MIIVYTGNGKGKTTAALGLALRALGWGKKVLIIQFTKGQETGEVKFIRQLNNIKIEQFGVKEFVDPKNLKEIDKKEALKGLEKAREEIAKKHWNLVILDEINVAVKFGLISKEEVLKLLRQKPKDLTLVLTGRWAPQEFIDAADLVTEFKEIKHPFKKRIKAQKGIDY